MNTLPLPDPNIDVLPLQTAICLVLVLLSCLMLLGSCAGTTYEPCVSITNADGAEVKACVRIERQKEEEKEAD